MGSVNFEFLKDEFSDIYNHCKKVEEHIKKEEYENSLSESRKTIELTIKTICSKEGEKYPKFLSNAITMLSRKKIIEPSISKQYHEIKDVGNIYSHADINLGKKKKGYDKTPQEEAFSIYHKLYNVVSNFYLEYNDAIDPNDVGRFQSIQLTQKTDIDELKESIAKLQESIDSQKVNSDPDSKNSETLNVEVISDDKEVEKKSWLDDHEYTSIKGSFLLGELNKLEESSREAVEGSESLSDFKRYLHVKRTIEDELYNKLVESKDSKRKLIMLCGSVGDGKSHLIARFNDEHPELMEDFTIVKDATESDAFDKTAIDTLMDKLSEFNNDNIENTDEKLILLINLGVLNNFIHSDKVKERYSELLGKLDNLSIFDSDDFSNKLDEDFISIISFSDYYIFEFDEDHPDKVKSQFISELFAKITENNGENPFYEAYRMDKNNNVNTPIIKNYELFSMPNVQRMIIFNLIKIIIKYKIFISTRELLNFIYEILVPADIKSYDDLDSPLSNIEDLLPNLLFGSDDRCDILKAINYEDPTLKRVEITDKLLIDLNTGVKLADLFDEYMDVKDLSFFEDIFDFDVIFNDYNDKDKKTISTSIIRFANIFGTEEVKMVFNKQSYLDYVDYLYHFNKSEQKYLKKLIADIKKAILKWKGSLSDEYMCIENLNKFKLGKSLNMEFKGINNVSNNDLNRFKTSMVLPFYKYNGPDDSVNLNIDYSLYEVITKLVRGYKPNNFEQKDLILFNEFIDNLMSSSSSNKCLICNYDENICFRLEYNETFEEYVFKRVI